MPQGRGCIYFLDTLNLSINYYYYCYFAFPGLVSIDSLLAISKEPKRLTLLKTLDTWENAVSAEWIGSNRVGCLLTAEMSIVCLLDGELLVLGHSFAEFHKIGIPVGVCE